MLQTPGINNQTLPVDDRRPVRRVRVPTTTVLGQAPRIFHHLTAVLCAPSTGQSLATHSQDIHVTSASVINPKTTPTAWRMPFAYTWSPSTNFTVTKRYTRECTRTVLQIPQIRCLLTHLYIRKAKLTVSGHYKLYYTHSHTHIQFTRFNDVTSRRSSHAHSPVL